MIFQKNQIHAFTPFKLRGKPHSKCKKSISHKKMVVNLQPQCDFCKNQLHHNEKRGLPRRFTIYFDSFCPNPKYDTGLPPIYIVNADCTWFWWRKLVVLLPLKLIFVVNILLSWNNRSAQRIRCAEQWFQLNKNAESNLDQFQNQKQNVNSKFKNWTLNENRNLKRSAK